MHNKKNFAIGLVATAPTPALSGTSLVLYPGQGADMPAVPFFMTAAPQGVLTTLNTAEVLEVTNVTDDTLTIVRAQKGTTAKEIGVDWLVANGIYTEDLDEYELLLPTTPEQPETKFLNGNKQWTEILVGGGGYASNLYYTTIDSDVSGYKKINYTAEATETIMTATVTNQEILARTYLFDDPLGVTSIDAGIWISNYTSKVSSPTGISQFKIEPFVRHTDNTETTLFSSYSREIDNTDYVTVRDETNQPSFTVSATDRLGIRIYAKTTSATAITLSSIAGDGRASYFSTPLSIRHSQLRDLNGDENNVHVTTDEKTAITHTNRTALDLVSGTNTGDQTGDGVTITGSGTELDPFVGVGSNQLITDETPTGLVNGANLNYTTAYAYTPGTMQVYINGVKQVRGTHFTEVGPGYTIFTMSDAPLIGDIISVNYQTTISTSGNADTVDGFNASSNPTANTIPVLGDNALFFPVKLSSAPTYVKGGIYFDTTLNKLRVGGVTTWETITSS